MVQPALYSGFGKQEDKTFGGLEKLSFISRCPPVVTSDTIIIAVCGIQMSQCRDIIGILSMKTQYGTSHFTGTCCEFYLKDFLRR